MSNENLPQIFNHKEFGNLTVIKKNDDIWFIVNEVCGMLGLKDGKNVARNLKKNLELIKVDTKGVFSITPLQTAGGIQNVSIVSEIGLYELIGQSRKKEAIRFRYWINSEVLPSIRKHGFYSTGQNPFENYTELDWIKKAVKTIEERDQALKEIEINKPKVEFAKAVEASKTDILIRDLAKILNQNGIDIGQNRLFKWLRKNGYLIKEGRSYNTPTQRAMDKGIFRVKEVVFGSDENQFFKFTPLVTGKGQIYFINLFKNAFNIVSFSKQEVN